MRNDVSTFELRSIRATDTNSLLRLYDLAKEVVTTSPLQQERARAAKAVERMVKELKKRNVTVAAVTLPSPPREIGSAFSSTLPRK